MKVVEKRFPATISRTMSTFLNNKKLDGELYAYFQKLSYPDENKRTVVWKDGFPTQGEICRVLGIKTPKTYRSHRDALIEAGYLIEEEDCYVLPNQEDIFLMIPLETLQFLLDTLTEQVIKIYIFLGQRYKMKEKEGKGVKYSFTEEEICAAIGLNVRTTPRYYTVVKNALKCLELLGLIEVKSYYEGQKPRLRLVNYSFQVKKLEG